MALDDWFLTAAERGNAFTRLDHRRSGLAHSRGNRARALVDGVAYFERLIEVIRAMEASDLLLFTDWRGDADELLAPTGPTVSELLCAAARRGVLVKGLFWRSHIEAVQYFERQNRNLANDVRRAGGEVILDQRVPPLGCHHQKLVVARHPGRPERDVAFAGGIDLCRTRRDDREHRGDPQTVPMGAVWGPTPAWHDVMIEIVGPAVGDIEATFRERWEDPASPVPDPFNKIVAHAQEDDVSADPLPPQAPDPAPVADGTHAVQVLRTLPRKLPRFPFAPSGEFSIARAYRKASARAESLVYLEDQYLWSAEVVACFADALRAHEGLRMVVVLSTYTSADTPLADASALAARGEALDALRAAGGDRVAVYGVENARSLPVYVHSKVCVVDDVWMTIGSDNVNLRSWTYDTELTCAVLDERADGRPPLSLRADADPARRLARELRLELAREHLDRADGDDADLVDPASMLRAFRECADALDAWHAAGRTGPRPPGRLRTYRQPEAPRRLRALGRLANRFGIDPDGRSRGQRGSPRF